MSSPTDDPEDGDWRGTLVALQQLHARLLTAAAELSGRLARPAACSDGEVMGLEWETEGLSADERDALYERVCADLQTLDALTEKLVQLSTLLEARGPTMPPTISP
jgi:hypothetical protein